MYISHDPSLKTYLIQLGLKSAGLDPGEADNWWGNKTEAAYQKFLESYGAKVLAGDGSWPFTARVIGDDIVVENIVITCFGGANDPQDNGETASGKNTKTHPEIMGVSLPMDGRQYSGLNSAEHRALDGSPFPRMPWGTLVEVTIGGKTFIPSAGIIDLGPGKQASHPGEPHACDLTEAAAKLFNPKATSTNFYARGNVRVIGGAKYT